mgnify:CR=1 FL=1|jgi:hypothetical protein
MWTEFADRCLDARLTHSRPERGRFTFEDAQLHVVPQHGDAPIGLATFMTGEAEVDARGAVTLIELHQHYSRSNGVVAVTGLPWVVPVGHELHALIAASLRITHGRAIDAATAAHWEAA